MRARLLEGLAAKKFIFLLILLLLLIANNSGAIDSPSLCNGFLAFINRPTAGDSPCVVPPGKIVAEMGYSYFAPPGGHKGQFFPQLELRWGLFASTEFIAALPSYMTQDVAPSSGWTAASAGIKHQLNATKQLLFTVEALVTAPSGSYKVGSAGLGTTFNSILAYRLTKEIEITGMLGVSSLTAPRQQQGERYNSVNPDLVLSWQPTDKMQFYLEAYGKTKTGPHQGSGANFGTGIQRLLRKNWEVDLSVAQRLYGNVSGFNHYISLGMGVLF